MASGIYNRFKANLMNKVVDLEGDSIYVCIYDNSHAFTATDHTYTTTNEFADGIGGYNRGANANNLLASKSVTEGATTKWDATDHAWGSSCSFTAYHAVIWNATASNSLICSIDFGGAKTVTAGTFTLKWHTDGIIALT